MRARASVPSSISLTREVIYTTFGALHESCGSGIPRLWYKPAPRLALYF
jgi:hypothetical protein